MLELLEQAKSQMLLLPDIVQIWMRWLNIIFLLGVLFVKNHNVARWALIAFFASFPVGFLVYYFTRDINLMGVPHVLFWAPLLFYIIFKELKFLQFNRIYFYDIWVVLLSLTIIISLFFDVRSIYLLFVQ